MCAGAPQSSCCTPPPSQGTGGSRLGVPGLVLGVTWDREGGCLVQRWTQSQLCCPALWPWAGVPPALSLWGRRAGCVWAGATRSHGCVCPPVTAKPPLGRLEGRRWRERAVLSGRRGLVSGDQAGARSSGTGCRGRFSRGPGGNVHVRTMATRTGWTLGSLTLSLRPMSCPGPTQCGSSPPGGGRGPPQLLRVTDRTRLREACGLPDVTQQVCVARVRSWHQPPRQAGVQVGPLRQAGRASQGACGPAHDGRGQLGWFCCWGCGRHGCSPGPQIMPGVPGRPVCAQERDPLAVAKSPRPQDAGMQSIRPKDKGGAVGTTGVAPGMPVGPGLAPPHPQTGGESAQVPPP